jgi:hypothetical protein
MAGSKVFNYKWLSYFFGKLKLAFFKYHISAHLFVSSNVVQQKFAGRMKMTSTRSLTYLELRDETQVAATAGN